MSRIRTVFAADIFTLLGLAGFVGVGYLVDRHLLSTTVQLKPAAALLLSALPALLWLGYFYSQDRHEPEPTHYVLGIYLLGALVAGPTSHFVIGQITAPGTILEPVFHPLATKRLIQTFLVTAVAQELCKYAVVRYTVYQSREFDEPMAGIVYMTAAGVGFATYENTNFLLTEVGDQLVLSVGIATVVVTTLAHACFAGVVGYALGRAKFATMSGLVRTRTLFLGLLGAVMLNGGFEVVRTVMGSDGLNVSPWRAVMFAFGFAALVFMGLSLAMHRLLIVSPHRPELKTSE